MGTGLRGRAAFAGRTQEFAALGSALDGLKSGRGARIAIRGEPGIGKTRLTQEAAALARQRGCRVVIGRATELEQHVPFAVVIAALDSALATFADSALDRIAPELVAELVPVFPALTRRGSADLRKLPAERYRLHHAITGLIAEIATERPLVLVLDDVHWADAASLELVAHLLRSPPDGPVLLMLAYRMLHAPSELLVAIGAAAREDSLTEIELVGLTECQAQGLIDGIDAGLRGDVYRESGGNPFYLEELAHAHVRRTRAYAISLDVAERQGVPAGVRVVIEQDKLRHLSDRARSVLRAASVVGDRFDPAIAAAVAEVSESEALAALDEAAALELVQSTDVARTLSFRHPILWRTVYESGGPAWRIGAHARAAHALAQQGAPSPRRAPHVERYARRGDESAIELLSAAAIDSAPHAPAVAARWFRAAFDLLPADAEPRREVALLMPLAASLTAVGQTSETRAVLGRLLALLPEEERELRANVLVLMARVDQMLGRQGRTRELIDQALRDTGDRAASCVLRLARCVDHWHSLELEPARSLAALALEDALLADRPELVVEALAQVALGACDRGLTGEALTRLDEAQRLVDGLTDEQVGQRVEGLGVLGHLNRDLDRPERASTLFERALRIVRETGQEAFFVPLTVGLATANVNLGRLNAARAESNAARNAAQLLRAPRLILWSEVVSCRTALASGDLREALVAGANATAYAQDSWNAMLSASAHLAFAAAQLESGEPAETRQRIVEHTGGPELPLVKSVLRPRWYRVLVESELALGRREAAENWTERAEVAAAPLSLSSATAHAEMTRAMILLADGDAQGASVLAISAAERLSSIGALVEAGRADTLAGRALARCDQRPDAIERLEHALALLGACHATRYRDHAARELRALGSRAAQRRSARSNAADGVAALTIREREVAELIAGGLSNRLIAERLFLSEKTIESHVSRILAKLGVASRLAVVGVLPPPR